MARQVKLDPALGSIPTAGSAASACACDGAESPGDEHPLHEGEDEVDADGEQR